MTTYITFLRGVNVGAHNRMTMDELRAVFESLGYDAVETHIQSGNVVFETTETDEATLREAVHDAIEEQFGYDISAMVRTRAELDAVVTEFPFDSHAEDGIKHYVTFLHDEPTEQQVEALLAAQNEAESFVVKGRAVYSELDKNSLGDGRFTDGGKPLGMETTRRSWNVVTAVHEMSQ